MRTTQSTYIFTCDRCGTSVTVTSYQDKVQTARRWGNITTPELWAKFWNAKALSEFRPGHLDLCPPCVDDFIDWLS